MIDVSPSWGSHAAMLERALSELPTGALVVEHGAGVYSTPLIARYKTRVAVVERASGWRVWASWLYGSAAVLAIDMAKRAIPYLDEAALVFIDGADSERLDLLKWSLTAGVPTIIAHDTEDGHYGWQSHLFKHAGYMVTHDGDRPRTTMWRRS